MNWGMCFRMHTWGVRVTCLPCYGGLAQLVERVTVNHKDVGSTPMSPANPRVVEARLNKRYAFWFCGKIRESMKSKNRYFLLCRKTYILRGH